MESIERWPERIGAAAAPPSPDENTRLDQAMQKADDLLFTSLKQDESRRRRRLIRRIGISIMFATVAIIYVLMLQRPRTAFLQRTGGGTSVPLSPLSHDPIPAKSTDDAYALQQKGWQLWQQQRYDEATDDFQQAVNLNPRLVNAWNGLGWSHMNSGDRDGALDAFKHVLILQPTHPAALNGVGQIYFAKGDFKNAETYLLKAADQAPAAWFGLTHIYLLESKWDQAATFAQRIIDSGQITGSDLAQVRQMLDAAKNKRLSPSLRAQITPMGYKPPTSEPAQ